MIEDQERTPLRSILQNVLNHVEHLEAQRFTEKSYDAEFQELKLFSDGLKNLKQYSCSEGEKVVNRKKNRYKDILPFNLSRVILNEYAGVPGSDYINANYIKGASGSPAYIACQGPLPHTVNDFWRMVVQCEVQVIVMACNQEEAGKHKCENYWVEKEEEEKQFGMVSIRLLKASTVCPDFSVRTMRLKYTNIKASKEERTICQFHYSAWPDHGVPPLVRPLLDMVRLVRDTQASETLPVLIHCSAGCGRTGTICAIDYVWGLLRAGKLSKDFSLLMLVREMRKQRIAMVQTKEQYVLVHQAVRELFREQLRMIDSHPYENIDSNGMPLVKQDLELTYDTVSIVSTTTKVVNEEKKDEKREKEFAQPLLPQKKKPIILTSKQEKEVENLSERQRLVERAEETVSVSFGVSGSGNEAQCPRIDKTKSIFEHNSRGSQVFRSQSLGAPRKSEGILKSEVVPVTVHQRDTLRVSRQLDVKPALPVTRSKSLKILGSRERYKLHTAPGAETTCDSDCDNVHQQVPLVLVKTEPSEEVLRSRRLSLESNIDGIRGEDSRGSNDTAQKLLPKDKFYYIGGKDSVIDSIVAGLGVRERRNSFREAIKCTPHMQGLDCDAIRRNGLRPGLMRSCTTFDLRTQARNQPLNNMFQEIPRPCSLKPISQPKPRLLPQSDHKKHAFDKSSNDLPKHLRSVQRIPKSDTYKNGRPLLKVECTKNKSTSLRRNNEETVLTNNEGRVVMLDTMKFPLKRSQPEGSSHKASNSIGSPNRTILKPNVSSGNLQESAEFAPTVPNGVFKAFIQRPSTPPNLRCLVFPETKPGARLSRSQLVDQHRPPHSRSITHTAESQSMPETVTKSENGSVECNVALVTKPIIQIHNIVKNSKQIIEQNKLIQNTRTDSGFATILVPKNVYLEEVYSSVSRLPSTMKKKNNNLNGESNGSNRFSNDDVGLTGTTFEPGKIIPKIYTKPHNSTTTVSFEDQCLFNDQKQLALISELPRTSTLQNADDTACQVLSRFGLDKITCFKRDSITSAETTLLQPSSTTEAEIASYGVKLRRGSRDDLALCKSIAGPTTPTRVKRHASVVLLRHSLVEPESSTLSLWSPARGNEDLSATSVDSGKNEKGVADLWSGAPGVDLDQVAASMTSTGGNQTKMMQAALESLRLRKRIQQSPQQPLNSTSTTAVHQLKESTEQFTASQLSHQSTFEPSHQCCTSNQPPQQLHTFLHTPEKQPTPSQLHHYTPPQLLVHQHNSSQTPQLLSISLQPQQFTQITPPPQKQFAVPQLSQQHVNPTQSHHQYISVQPSQQQYTMLQPSQQHNFSLQPSRQQYTNLQPSQQQCAISKLSQLQLNPSKPPIMHHSTTHQQFHHHSTKYPNTQPSENLYIQGFCSSSQNYHPQYTFAQVPQQQFCDSQNYNQQYCYSQLQQQYKSVQSTHQHTSTLLPEQQYHMSTRSPEQQCMSPHYGTEFSLQPCTQSSQMLHPNTQSSQYQYAVAVSSQQLQYTPQPFSPSSQQNLSVHSSQNQCTSVQFPPHTQGKQYTCPPIYNKIHIAPLLQPQCQPSTPPQHHYPLQQQYIKQQHYL